MTADLTADGLKQLLDPLRAEHNVVGATLGVLQNGAIETAASGLLNLDTAVECTPDSVFQIGSIGKIFTTTLIMQLIDEGRLSLDDPVKKHLPGFAIADMDAARRITIRQLLNHTSGMEGDLFPPDDPEGPSTASYLRKMYLLPSLYPPGEGPMTYCNAGFVTAGRIVELMTGKPWQTAVMERICKPIALTHAFAHPHESLRFRCAMGHIADPKDATKIRTAPGTFLSLSAAAAGSVLSMSVADVLRFAKVHMADGAYGDGRQLLSADAARRMRSDPIAIPPFGARGVTHWGLGWLMCVGHGYTMVGHDGGTLGQYTYLRTFPELGVAFALFTNAPSLKLYSAVEAELMRALVGKAIPPEPPAKDFDLKTDRYTGRYSNIASHYTIAMKDSRLSLHGSSPAGLIPEMRATLEPYCEDVFTLRAPGMAFDGQKISFLEREADGRSRYLRSGSRMARRVPG
jgi:CubicO group peptidase (beta-lactamase class C family)